MYKSPGPPCIDYAGQKGGSPALFLVIYSNDLCYSWIYGLIVKAFVIAGIGVSLANLRKARLHSRRNPEAWYTRLTARPRVDTPVIISVIN